jgi:hypothetical protein
MTGVLISCSSRQNQNVIVNPLSLAHWSFLRHRNAGNLSPPREAARHRHYPLPPRLLYLHTHVQWPSIHSAFVLVSSTHFQYIPLLYLST